MHYQVCTKKLAVNCELFHVGISELDAARGASEKYSESYLGYGEEYFSCGNEAQRQLWNFLPSEVRAPARGITAFATGI